MSYDQNMHLYRSLFFITIGDHHSKFSVKISYDMTFEFLWVSHAHTAIHDEIKCLGPVQISVKKTLQLGSTNTSESDRIL